MNLPVFSLKSLASGPQGQSLFLNADNFGNVTIQYSIAPTTEWYLSYAPEFAAVMIINSASGQALTASSDNRTVATSQDLTPSAHNTWTFSSSAPGAAIRPAYNDDLNLNVEGNSYPAGTKVILYKWDGNDNTKWTAGIQPNL